MINKDTRAGRLYNDLLQSKEKLLFLKYLQDNNIKPLTAFNILCEIVFSGYTSTTNLEYKETFEKIIKYYSDMIDKDTT